MTVPLDKLHLVEYSLLRRKARRTASPAAQARAKVQADRAERHRAQQQLLLQAQAVARMRGV